MRRPKRPLEQPDSTFGCRTVTNRDNRDRVKRPSSRWDAQDHGRVAESADARDLKSEGQAQTVSHWLRRTPFFSGNSYHGECRPKGVRVCRDVNLM